MITKEILIELGFKKEANSDNLFLGFGDKLSDAFFMYYIKSGRLDLLCSDSGDTSVIMYDIKSIEKVKEFIRFINY